MKATDAGEPEIVSTPATQFLWRHSIELHPIKSTLTGKQAEQKRWGKREMGRQVLLASFEKALLAPPRLSQAVRESLPGLSANDVKSCDGIARIQPIPFPCAADDLGTVRQQTLIDTIGAANQ